MGNCSTKDSGTMGGTIIVHIRTGGPKVPNTNNDKIPENQTPGLDWPEPDPNYCTLVNRYCSTDVDGFFFLRNMINPGIEREVKKGYFN